MIDISDQLQCSECTYFHDEGFSYCWCSFWGLDEGEAVVEPDGYCSNAMEREDEID